MSDAILTSESHSAEINKLQLLKIPNAITDILKSSDMQGYSCLVYAYGSQPKKMFEYFKRQSGLEVFDYYRFVPWYLLPLAIVAASHGGLIKVTDSDQLPLTINLLSRNGLVDVFIVPDDLVSKFQQKTRRYKWRTSFSGEFLNTLHDSIGWRMDAIAGSENYFILPFRTDSLPGQLDKIYRATTDIIAGYQCPQFPITVEFSDPKTFPLSLDLAVGKLNKSYATYAELESDFCHIDETVQVHDAKGRKIALVKQPGLITKLDYC